MLIKKRRSDIPIQQDTDIQFNKPTVKSAICPFHSSMRDTEPLATHVVTLLCHMHHSNNDKQSAPEITKSSQ